MKTIVKTESLADFLARGGKVTKCPTKEATKKYSTKLRKPVSEEQVDMSLIPAALKISLGIKI